MLLFLFNQLLDLGIKALTEQELEYAQNGVDYKKNPLTESFSIYQDYAKDLEEIKTCVNTIDLRGVFDTEIGPIYWDEAHVSDRGNSYCCEITVQRGFSYRFRKLWVQ